ncbi:hypothetical protein GA0115251_11521, partial [Streptomyces sp. TverLS-915]
MSEGREAPRRTAFPHRIPIRPARPVTPFPRKEIQMSLNTIDR